MTEITETKVIGVFADATRRAKSTGARKMEAQLVLNGLSHGILPSLSADKETQDLLASGVFDLLQELDASDPIDGMLNAQILACHTVSMNCHRLAILKDQTFAGRELYLKHGAKMAATVAKLVATREKRKNGARQTVTVKHIHVNEGGQAIVGNVETGGS